MSDAGTSSPPRKAAHFCRSDAGGHSGQSVAVSKRRQWLVVAVVVLVVAIAGAIWLFQIGEDFDCTADRQDAIETGLTPPDCE